MIQLVCLPFAGAGASIFKEWENVNQEVEIFSVQLPGREKRFMEPAFEVVQNAAKDAYAQVQAELNPDLPVIVFGHSLGGVLAFETARLLEQSGRFTSLALVVSGSPAPWTQRQTRASDLTDDEAFLEQVGRLSGYIHPALEDPMMRELLLPTLRADVKMHENYVPATQAPINASILVLRGADDELVSSDDIVGWKEAGAGQVNTDTLPGGHMYFIEHPEQLLAKIAQTSASLLAENA